MAFNFPAFAYIVALIVDAFLIFFSLFHVIAFDELKTDYKNPIDQCNSLNPVSFGHILIVSHVIKHLFLACLTGVHTSYYFQHFICCLWRMVVTVFEHPINSLSYKSVQNSPCNVWIRHIWSYKYYECRYTHKVSEGGMDQAWILLAKLLLLLIWVCYSFRKR